MSSSNSELRHRKKNSMTTTIAATAAKVALQARQVVRPLLRRGVARCCRPERSELAPAETTASRALRERRRAFDSRTGRGESPALAMGGVGEPKWR
jgi:hypothetical protein